MKESNTVIKVLTEEHGLKVIKWWKDKGVCTILKGIANESEGDTFIYYGLINGRFDSYSLSQVKENGAKIIKLPIKKLI